VPLIWRVLLGNVVVVTAGVVLLALAPVTISSPVAASEVAVLAGGAALVVVIDFFLLRQAFRPVHALTRAMREVDPLRPGARLSIATTDPEIQGVTRSFNEMVRRLEDERRLSAQRMLAAQEAERTRVSRELHDEIGQLLTSVLLRLSSLERRAPMSMRAELSDAREDVRRSMDEVREIAHQLRPPVLQELGLPSALAALAGDVARHGDLNVQRDIDRSVPALTDEREVVAYRVAQESLTNVVRHAQADHAWLRWALEDDAAVLEVRDDGSGFAVDATAERGGLTGMRERALLAGGTIAVTSTPGRGTTVRLTLPMEET
jgi:two-component system sensor histidine kinase UhpB